MAQPFASLYRGGFIAAGQGQQGFEFACAQIGPKGVRIGDHANHGSHGLLISQIGLVQHGQQINALFVVQIRQIQHRFAPDVGHAIVVKVQVVNRVDLGHARHQHPAGIDTQMFVISNVDLKTVLVNAVQGPLVILRGGTGEIPVHEYMVWTFAQKAPMHHAAGIDKMALHIGRTGRFFQVERGRRKAGQGIQSPALQQFGQSALQGHFEAGMRAKTGEATLVFRVQQSHIHHRVLASQGGVFDPNAESCGTQCGNPSGHARKTLNHRLRYIRQAKTFTDDPALDVACKNFSQGLRACLGRRIAGRHAVAHIQIVKNIDRHIDRFPVTLARIGNGANPTLFVARVEID